VVSDGGDGFFELGSTPLEGVFGAHYRVAEDFKVGAGVGPGFTRGLGAPEVRTVVSLEWFPEPEKPKKPVPVPAPRDRDGDGILDDDDACIDEPGVESDVPEKHGCPIPPDRDSDGILDADDACIDEPGVASEDASKHGCPVPGDRDGDGIVDEEDACPDEKGVSNTDEPSKHGCPVRDRDKDGILDDADACIDTVGVPSDDPSKNGCPKAKIESGRVKILDRIEFDTSKATIRSGSIPVLDAVLAILKEHSEIQKLRVEGHTDNRGAPWYNKNLSRKRAASVVDWLVERGIDRTRLTSEGKGQESPIDTNETDEGRQNNRRVEFHIVESEEER